MRTVKQMELINKLPDYLFYNIHQKALAGLSTRDKSTYTVGMHTANMNINGIIKKTIIPPLNIYISTITEKGVISSDIDYRITYNGQTFPLGHVYGASGYLCLGDIPVPAFVSRYDLMHPLETLFLYNDRNKHHGSPRLNISKNKHMTVCRWCEGHDIYIDQNQLDYIANDTVWYICSELLERYDTNTAYRHADALFTIIFNGSVHK